LPKIVLFRLTARKALGDHRLPRVTKSTSENIPGADEIGIRAVVATATPETLSSPVFLSHRPTAGACPGGVSGIDGDKTNTVLLGQHCNPCERLPVCPRGHSLAELFTSTGFFAGLHVLEVFDSQGLDRLPREFFDHLIKVVLSCATGAQASFAPRLTPANTGTNSFSLQPIFVSIGVHKELMDANVHGKRLPTLLYRQVRNSYPEGGPRVSQSTSLKEFCTGFGQPEVKALMALEGNDDGIALGEAGDFENVVEGALALFDFGNQTAQADILAGRRPASSPPEGLGRPLGKDDGFESELEAIGSVASRETASGHAGKSG